LSLAVPLNIGGSLAARPDEWEVEKFMDNGKLEKHAQSESVALFVQV